MTKQREPDLCADCKNLAETSSSKPLAAIEDILVYLNCIRDKKQEYFICLSLDSQQRLIKRRVVTIGLLDQTLAHPREIFAGPITDRAASIIIAHNHPSGDPTPSRADIDMTQQIVAVGQVLGTPLLDHIVVSYSEHYSFRACGLI